MDKFSYALGLNIGNNLTSSGITNLDFESFTAGISDILTKNPLKISIEEAQAALNERFDKITEEASKETIAEGQAFLAGNTKKAGVVVLPSGLQYKIITVGTGVKPKISDKVRCHYHGTLINGTVFDSSVQRGQPAVFGVNQVIKGWVEALQLMPVGSKWQLFIPSDLAYGKQGAGQQIPPHTTLIFEVELLEII